MSRPEGIPEGVDYFELGHGQYWSRLANQAGEWIGILEWHPCTKAQNATDDGLSAGGVYFEGANLPDHAGRPRWRVESQDPLTLSPSILCRTCGNHGFIREGRWVPA